MRYLSSSHQDEFYKVTGMRTLFAMCCVFFWIPFVLGAQNTLSVGAASGPAGSGGHRIPIYLDNAVSVAGLQWTMTDVKPLLVIDSVVTTARTRGFTLMTGTNTVLLFDMQGKTIDPGSGAITEMILHVDSTATDTTVALDLNPIPLLSTKAGQVISDIQIIAGAFQITSDTAVPNSDDTVAGEDRVMQNYPNPFNAATFIAFSLKEPGYVEISVFDLNGRSVAVLVRKIMSKGRHSVSFDAHELPSGLYFYRVSLRGFAEIRKMMLIK
jgi:hypothetical protein